MKCPSLIFTLIMSACVGFAQPMAHKLKYSGDYTQQFLYFSPAIALVKQFGKDESGSGRFWFEFVVASPGPDPELASFAGDSIDKVLIKNPARFVINSDYIAGEMADYDWGRRMPTSVTFALRLSTNEVFYDKPADEILKKMLDSSGRPSDVAFLPTLVAFDKYAIEHLRRQMPQNQP
jgi:hypothetical protein